MITTELEWLTDSEALGENQVTRAKQSLNSNFQNLTINHIIVIGHLSTNSIRNKIESLRSIIQGEVDILLISETKIEESFPTTQFLMDGFYRPFRLDRNSEGGGLLLYVNENIPFRKLKNDELPSYIGLFIEINLIKKRLLFGGYNPRKNDASYYLAKVSKYHWTAF